MADYLLVFGVDALGAPVADRVLAPAGDWALVSGANLVAQQILLYLFTAQGAHPTDPTFGGGLVSSIGLPEQSEDFYALLLAEAVSYYQARAALYPTPLGEQIADVAQVTLASIPGQVGNLQLSFVITTAAGSSAQATAVVA